jgi:hypothetical protein
VVPSSTGTIHIEFSGRALVSVVGCADPALVRVVLIVLDRTCIFHCESGEPPLPLVQILYFCTDLVTDQPVIPKK